MADKNFKVKNGLDIGDNVSMSVTETTISTGSETTIASFSKTSAESAECIVKVKQGDRLYSTKVLVLQNGTTADFTKYGDLAFTDSGVFYVGGLTSSASVVFNTDISGSNIRLRATIPDAATTNATVKVLTTTVGES